MLRTASADLEKWTKFGCGDDYMSRFSVDDMSRELNFSNLKNLPLISEIFRHLTFSVGGSGGRFQLSVAAQTFRQFGSEN